MTSDQIATNYAGDIDIVNAHRNNQFYLRLQKQVRKTGKILVLGKRKVGHELSLEQFHGIDKSLSLDVEVARLKQMALQKYLGAEIDYLKHTTALCGMYVFETSCCNVQHKTQTGGFTSSISTRSLPLMQAFAGGLSQQTMTENRHFLLKGLDEQIRTGKVHSIRLEHNSRGVPTLRQEVVNLNTMKVTPHFLLIEAATYLLRLCQSSPVRIRYAEGTTIATRDVSLCRGFLFRQYHYGWQSVLAGAWDGKSATLHLPVCQSNSQVTIEEFNLYRICAVVPFQTTGK
ncbi:hypothetical protein [Clostridium minihomine]|uniref:hypothetical protein n=1 Tax=Clostridium minihomine TaxID=2045012 RepID=UPI000C76A5EC|nr:hypothetical protein [Clostridium minihomine]